MTVAELIEELKSMPQHHTVMIDIGLRYDESIYSVRSHGTKDVKVGPTVVINTVSDSRNDPGVEHIYLG